MTANNYLIDTSAWIEYFQGTSLGQRVKDVVNDKNSSCFTIGIVLAELTSTLIRNGHDPEPCCEHILSISTMIEPTHRDYLDAGIKHAELKKTENRISYSDALLLTLSEKRKMKIVSKDEHLRGKNTLFLR